MINQVIVKSMQTLGFAILALAPSMEQSKLLELKECGKDSTRDKEDTAVAAVENIVPAAKIVATVAFLINAFCIIYSFCN